MGESQLDPQPYTNLQPQPPTAQLQPVYSKNLLGQRDRSGFIYRIMLWSETP